LYALHDTKTPVFVGVVMMSLNVGLSLAFSALFTHAGWMPHGGLALANSLATFFEMCVLLIIMRRRLRGLEGGRVWSGLWKALVALFSGALFCGAGRASDGLRFCLVDRPGGVVIGIWSYICLMILRGF
jgi:putative peptidoglycan lipid II flippase